MSRTTTGPENDPEEREESEEEHEEDNDPDEEIEHQNLFWDGALPAADGEVALQFAKTTPADQIEFTTKVYTFLLDPNANPLTLNAETRPLAAMLSLPDSNLVRLVYSLGYGASGIGDSSPTDRKFLVLSGEGGAAIGSPQVFTLPSTITDIQAVKCPTLPITLASLSVEKNSWYRAKANDVTTTFELMKIAPIPAYLVFDGFNKDLEAETVLERLLQVDDQENEMIAHGVAFTQACLVKHTANGAKQHLPPAVFMQQQSVQAKTWATTKFKTLLPAASTGLGPGSPAKDNDAFTSFMSSMQNNFHTPDRNRDSRGPTVVTPEEKYGMSETELSSTLKLCGLKKGDEHLLPAWLLQMSEKGQNDNTRNQIIIKRLQKVLYDDAEIPITAPLLTMIRKRKWLSDDPVPSLRTASKGLSIFAVVQMSEDQVASINEMMEALENATTTTAREYREVTTIVARVPDESYEFQLLLKTYANLLYALFESQSPIYAAVKQIIKALNAYKRNALTAMPKRTKATILWIILLQTRHFAAGNENHLSEFKTMCDKLTAKDMSISHAEVPTALYEDKPATEVKPGKRKAEEGVLKDPIDKKGKKTPLGPLKIHPKLKEKIYDPIMKNNPSYSLTKLAKYSNTSLPAMALDKSKCLLHFFGKCTHPNCSRRHLEASDDEADHIINLLEKAIIEPEGLSARG